MEEQRELAHFAAPSAIAKQSLSLGRVRIIIFLL